MKAFWWYEEGKIAGMARPGFNHCGWFDLPFDEALVMGWIGQHSSGAIPLASLREHLRTYLPKVAPFYDVTPSQVERLLHNLENLAFLGEVVAKLAKRSRFIGRFSFENGTLHFETNKEQLLREIAFLKQNEIRRIVSLTESHHDKAELAEHFALHHIGITDLHAPSVDQVHELKEIVARAENDGERLAVHCLAGIGRTTTMLVGAGLLRGHKLNDLLVHAKKRNPVYEFVGSQAAFIRELEKSLSKQPPGELPLG